MEIYHYSIIDLFKRIGADLGYLPIKEFSLMNIGEITEERIDLVWIKNSKVEYAFEFETTSTKKSLDKLMRLSENIRKYIFFVRKSFNFESVDAIFIGDSNGIDFLNNLKKYNMKVTMHGNEVKSSSELVEEIAAEDRENTRKKIEHIAEHGNTK